MEHAENQRNHIYVRTQTRSCDQASPSDSMACGHHCFLCLSEQSKGTVSPSETSFTALNAISCSPTVCPWPSPQLSPSYSKHGLQCTWGRHEGGWKGSSVGGTRRGRYPFIHGMDVQVTKFKTLRKAMIPEHGRLAPALQFL